MLHHQLSQLQVLDFVVSVGVEMGELRMPSQPEMTRIVPRIALDLQLQPHSKIHKFLSLYIQLTVILQCHIESMMSRFEYLQPCVSSLAISIYRFIGVVFGLEEGEYLVEISHVELEHC